MWGLIGFYLLVGMSSIALGQEPEFIEEVALLNSWPGLAKVIAYVVALQIALRGISEALLRIADYTETKWDNKVAAWLSQASWILGSLLGKFGYSTPKPVLEHKAAQLAEAKANSDSQKVN